MSTPFDELKTIVKACEKMSYSLAQTSEEEIDFSLLSHWAEHYTVVQKEVLNSPEFHDVLSDTYRISGGLFLWLLQKNKENIYSGDLSGLAKKTHFAQMSPQIYCDLHACFLKEMKTNPENATDFGLCLVRCFCEQKNDWKNNSDVLKVLTTFREEVFNVSALLSEKLMDGLPKSYAKLLYDSDKDTYNKKALINKMRRLFLPYNIHRFNSNSTTDSFLEMMFSEPLAKQIDNSNMFYNPLKELLEQLNPVSAQKCVEQLLENGWSKELVGSLFSTRSKYMYFTRLDTKFIDLLHQLLPEDDFSENLGHALHFIAQRLYQAKELDFLPKVKHIFASSYAPQSCPEIQLTNLSEFHSFMVQKVPNGSHRTDKPLTDFLVNTTPLFQSSEMHEIVTCLQTINEPSFRGLLDLWGRLHGVDFEIDGNKKLLFKNESLMENSHSKSAKQLGEKIKELKTWIDLNGQLVDEGLGSAVKPKRKI